MLREGKGNIMIKQEILEKLLSFTDEEIDNLNGKGIVDTSIYTPNKVSEIDYRKLMLPNQMLSVRKHARFFAYPKHKHNYIEMMYVYSGTMSHEFEGNKVVIKKGEFLLLNQNIEHSIEFTDENDIIFNFIIRPEFFEFLSSLSDQENLIFDFLLDSLYSNKNEGEYLVFHVADNKKIRDVVDDIITNVYENNLSSTITIKLLVGLLLMELLNQSESIESYSNDCYEKILNNAILRYINTSYKEGSLAILSQNLHQPDYKICRVIKKSTGNTFKQLIQEARLNQTVRLLNTTNLSITSIMEEVGYENITYFYKIFKDKYHMTPKDYREQM